MGDFQEEARRPREEPKDAFPARRRGHDLPRISQPAQDSGPRKRSVEYLVSSQCPIPGGRRPAEHVSRLSDEPGAKRNGKSLLRGKSPEAQNARFAEDRFPWSHTVFLTHCV